MKNIQSKFKSLHQKKTKKIKLQMNEHEIFWQQALILVCLDLSYL